MLELQHPRFGSALQSLFGIQGSGPGLSLASDVFPTIPLEREGPELDFLRGWERSMYGITVVAGVGQWGHVTVVPAAFDFIAVLEKLVLSTTVAGAGIRLGLRRSGGIPPAMYATDARDDDGSADPAAAQNVGVGVTSALAGAALLPNTSFVVVPGATSCQVDGLGVVIGPVVRGPQVGASWSLIAEGTLANQDLTVAMVWRTRRLTLQERVNGG